MNTNMNRIGLATVLSAGLVLASTQGIAAQQDCRTIEDNAERLACYDREAAPPAPPPARAEAPTAPVEKAPVETIQASPGEPRQSVPEIKEEATAGAAAAAGEVEEPGPEYVQLDETVGIEDLENGDKERQILIRGTVVRCEKDVRKKMMFFFDNGQIWKQKDSKTVPWSKCSFQVTISKDFFGYKMLPDGEKREIRISRIK